MAANRLTRRMLGEFLKSPETIRAFESLDTGNADLEAVVSQMRDAAVLVLSLTDAFTNQRVVTSDGEVEITDGGAGGSLTFGLSDTGVSAGVYGSAAHTVQFTVNAKGRLSLAQAHALNSDNVTEGVTNLFFTNARARSALSSGAGMAYDSATGVIAAGTVLAAYAGGDTPSPFTLGIVDSVDAAAWRAAIGAGTSTVTPSALTKTDDTNVTLTLGGTPSTALIAATSLTLGWAGTLSVARGGTGGGSASGTLLDNISGFASTGQIVRTGAGSYAFRTLTAPAAGITVSNGSGVSGNPTLALADDLAALEALSGTNTIYYRSGASAWSAVTIGSDLSFSGGTLTGATGTGTGSIARATKPQFTNTIGVGTAASASGSGVSFPATQSASADPNTLDDYEEGSWSPGIAAGSGTFTNVSATGEYTKIGNLVTASVEIVITTNGTAAGFITCSLPFTSSAVMGKIGWGRDVTTGPMLSATVDAASSSMLIVRYDNAYPGASGRTLRATISYTV